MAGYGASMLEANPGALAVVIIFFLVFTLGFEHALHWLKHYLAKRKKFGLLGAVTAFSNEIMLLGFAILILLVCEDRIVQACYKVPTEKQGKGVQTLQPWLSRVVGTQKQKGCACCLANTRLVSECFIKAKGCPEVKEMEGVCPYYGLPYFKGIMHDSKVLPVPYPYNATYPPDHGNSSYAGGYGNSSGGYGGSSGGYGGSNGSYAGSSGSYAGSSGSYGGSSAGYGSSGRRLLAPAAAGGAAVECLKNATGSYMPHQAVYPECNNKDGTPRPGYAPVVSIATLHQVHYFLFCMAGVHIVTGCVVLLISSSKLKWYAKRSGGSKEDDTAALAIKAAQRDYDSKAHLGGCDSYKSFKVVPEVTPGEETGPDTATAQDSGSSQHSAFATAAAARDTEAGHDSSSSSSPKDAVVAKVEPWHGRPVKMGWKDYCIEVLVYLVRHLTLWNTVSKQEYAVLRGCFYYTHAHTLTKVVHGDHGHGHGHGHDEHGHGHDDHGHGHAHPHDMQQGGHAHGTGLRPEQINGAYAPYLTEQVERDAADVVGLGLPMWLFLILFVLVSGVIGWATWLFLILAGVLLLFLNMVLLTSLRHMTKGGQVLRQHKGWYQWLHRSNFLLSCIKLNLFFFTFVISNGVFMSLHYGAESCFFSRTGFQYYLPIPWWGIMVIDVMLLINLAMFTLPVYSLTYHTLVVDKTLLQNTVKDILYKQACEELKKSGDFTRAGSKPGSGGAGGSGGNTLQRMMTSLRETLTWSSNGSGSTSMQTRRSLQSGTSKRWDAAVAAQNAAPISDSKRWNRLQSEMSV